MNILIFFQYSNHNQTIDELCKNLNEWKVEASSFNVATWRFRKKNHIGKVSWVSFLSLLAVIPGLRGFLTTLFRYKALCRLSDNYSIIDIHFFSSIYDKLIEELKRRGKKIKITIWGSDFYRASKVRREEQRKLYHTN
jgi:IS1 family transposase